MSGNIDMYIEKLFNGKHLLQNEIKDLCMKVIEILTNEKIVLQVQTPVTVVGDIHGQFQDLLEIFKISGRPPDTNFLFLGDYVDRGSNSVETISLIYALKVKYKNRVTILRGNHESKEINKVYGFYDECRIKYGNEQVWKMFADTFIYLPLVAIIQLKILCMHGGLSPKIQTIDSIKNLNKCDDVDSIGTNADLLWSDPSQKNIDWENSPRGAGWLWGPSVTKKFCQQNDIEQICRAHQLVMNGFEQHHDNQVVTVFSAPNYCYRCGNKAAIIEFNEQLQSNFQQFDPFLQTFKEQKVSKRVPEYFL